MRRNSYMTHEENVLLVMFGDKAADVQAEGVAIVRQLRHRPEAERMQVRSFRAPTDSTDAQSYTELVDLHALISGGANLEPPLAVPPASRLIRNQRSAPLTTEAVGAVSGAGRQRGLSLNKGAYRGAPKWADM